MALVAVSTWALTVKPTSADPDQYAGFALNHGPQFLALWTEEDRYFAEQALIKLEQEPAILNRSRTLENAKKRFTLWSLREKLKTPGVTWATPDGERVRYHVQMRLDEQILMGLAFSRFYCTFENEDLGDDEQSGRAQCDYLNQEAKRMYEQHRNNVASFGGNDGGVVPWATFQALVDLVR
jgi:hypothetical protein